MKKPSLWRKFPKWMLALAIVMVSTMCFRLLVVFSLSALELWFQLRFVALNCIAFSTCSSGTG